MQRLASQFKESVSEGTVTRGFLGLTLGVSPYILLAYLAYNGIHPNLTLILIIVFGSLPFLWTGLVGLFNEQVLSYDSQKREVIRHHNCLWISKRESYPIAGAVEICVECKSRRPNPTEGAGEITSEYQVVLNGNERVVLAGWNNPEKAQKLAELTNLRLV